MPRVELKVNTLIIILYDLLHYCTALIQLRKQVIATSPTLHTGGTKYQ